MTNHSRVTIIVLFISVALLVTARIHTYVEPIERDLATYAVVAHEMLNGRSLYSDVWDMKPPAIFWAYAIAEKLVGYGDAEIFFLNVICALVSLVGIFFAGKALGNSIRGGLFAVLVWSIFASNIFLEANQPNTEVFINALLVWAFVVLVWPQEQLQVARSLLFGSLVAAGSLFKEIAIAFILVFGIYSVLGFKRNSRQGLNLAAVLFPIMLAWSLVFVWFAISGRFNAIYESIYVYPRFYSGSLYENIFRSFQPPWRFPPFAQFLTVPLLITVFGMCQGMRTNFSCWILLIGFAIAVKLQIALPGKFFPHYYQLWLPVISIGVGWTFDQLLEQESLLMRRILPVSFLLLLLPLVFLEMQTFRLSPDEISRKKYGNIFIATKSAGRLLAQHTESDERLYHWGIDPGIFFYSRRRPVTGVLWADKVLWGPLADKFLDRTLRELDANPPKWIVLGANFPFQNAPLSLQKWIRASYSTSTEIANVPPFEILRRKL